MLSFGRWLGRSPVRSEGMCCPPQIDRAERMRRSDPLVSPAESSGEQKENATYDAERWSTTTHCDALSIRLTPDTLALGPLLLSPGMLYRGTSVRVHHTKSDINESILAGIPQEQMDAAHTRRRRTEHKTTTDALREQMQRNAHVEHAPAGSRTHRPRLEVSKEMRERGGVHASMSDASAAAHWSGMHTLGQRSTTATRGLISVPLRALAATGPAPSAAATAAPGSSGSGVLSVAAIAPAVPEPSRRSTRLEPFASEFASVQAARRADQTARRHRAAQEILFVPQLAPAMPDSYRARTDQRAQAQLMQQQEALRQQQQIEAASRHVAPAKRLAVPHLPASAELEAAAVAADSSADASQSMQLYDAPPPVPAPSPAVTARVPDAQVIFLNFQRWLESQRGARRAHARALAAHRAAVQEAAEAAERDAVLAEANATTGDAARRAKTPPGQTPLSVLWQQLADATTSEEGPDSNATSTAAASAAPAALAAAPTLAAPPLPPMPPAFVPTLYSYPRLQYTIPPSSSLASGSPAAGSGSSVKFQAHLVCVTSLAEIRRVWDAFLEHMRRNNASARDQRKMDGVIRNRAFAFQIARSGRRGEDEEEDEGEEDESDRPHSAEASEEESKDHSVPSSSSPTLHVGFEDGTDRGIGAKLLHLLQTHQLTNVMLLITESGAVGPLSADADAETGLPPPLHHLPTTPASTLLFKQSCICKTAKIMLQDYVRLQAGLVLRDSERAVAMQQTREGGAKQREESKEQQHSGEYERSLADPSTDLAGSNTVVDAVPTVSLFRIPLDGSAPVPLPLEAAAAVAPVTRISPRRPPLPPHLQQSLWGTPEQLQAPHHTLPVLTPSDEEQLRAEILQLLSGQAYVRMSAPALTRNHGAHAPKFLALWSAYLTFLHCNQEAPEVITVSDRTPRPEVAARGGLSGGDASGFAQQALAMETGQSSAGRKGPHAGRLAGSMKPSPSSGVRLERKLRALMSGVGGLALDGFTADNAAAAAEAKRHPGSGAGSDPLAHLQPTGRRGLNLRGGSGFAGQAGLQLDPVPGLISPITSLDDEQSATTAREDASRQQQPSSRAAKAQAKLAAQLAAEEEANAAEFASLLTSEQWASARRKTLLHTSASIAHSQAQRISEHANARPARMDAVDTGGSTAAVYLELQRTKAVQPAHVVPSLLHLYHNSLQMAFQFKAKLLATRLSRGALAQIAAAYPGSDPATHLGAEPPFLVRLLLLAVGVLLRWRSLQWRSMLHYLRGEVLCTTLSPFLLSDQDALATYLATQDAESGPLPAPLAPEKMARSVWEREEMEQRVKQFEAQYLRATRGPHMQQQAAGTQHKDPAGASDLESVLTGPIAAGSASAASSSFAPSPDFASVAPRDLMVHLMSMDVLHMTARQYEQVRSLFNEPTMTRANLAALSAPVGGQALLLFEWILLSMRAYNVWRACRLAFVEMAPQDQEQKVDAYRRRIQAVALNSQAIQQMMREQQLQMQQEKIQQQQQQQPGPPNSGSNVQPSPLLFASDPSTSSTAKQARLGASRKPPVPRRSEITAAPGATTARQPRKAAASSLAESRSAADSPSSDDDALAEDDDAVSLVTGGSESWPSRPVSRVSRPWSGRVSRPTSALRRSAAAADSIGGDGAPSSSSRPFSSLLWGGSDRSGLGSPHIRSIESPYSDAPSRMMG